MLLQSLRWERRPSVESYGRFLDPAPPRTVAAKCYMNLPVRNGKLFSCPLIAHTPVLLDDDLETLVGYAWGHRYVVHENEVLHEYDILLTAEYQERYGARRNQQFEFIQMVMNDDIPERVKNFVAIRTPVRMTFSPFLPSEVKTISPFIDMQHRLAQGSARAQQYQTYHKWFRLFFENREWMFN